jgi:membrane-bound metal-dependent hydrolase YbcI (DUF457 family)
MDTLTHGIAGALAGKAFFAQRHGRAATVGLALGAVFPDSDVFFELIHPNELATLEWHRNITHSFLALPVFAALLAGATRWILRGRGPRFGVLWSAYALGIASHIFFDLITSFGTMIWSPASRARPAWDLVFIIDFYFTGAVLLPQVAAWIYAERTGARRRGLLVWLLLAVVAVAAGALVTPLFEIRFPLGIVLAVGGLLALLLALPAARGWGFGVPRRTWCRAGVAVLGVYLALCAVCHQWALSRVAAYARAQNLEAENLAAIPGPLGPFRWSGLILTPAGVHQSHFHLLTDAPVEYEFFASAPPNRYIEIAETLPSVQTFRWFARFPVVSYRNTGALHIVEYTDRRFHTRLPRRSPFTFRVLLNEAGEVLSAGFFPS